MRTDKTIDDGFVDALSGIRAIIAKMEEADVLGATSPEIFPDSCADTLRNAALRIEKNDLRLACDLMILAHKVRPGGPVIKRMLEEYRRKLKK